MAPLFQRMRDKEGQIHPSPTISRLWGIDPFIYPKCYPFLPMNYVSVSFPGVCVLLPTTEPL